MTHVREKFAYYAFFASLAALPLAAANAATEDTATNNSMQGSSSYGSQSTKSHKYSDMTKEDCAELSSNKSDYSTKEYRARSRYCKKHFGKSASTGPNRTGLTSSNSGSADIGSSAESNAAGTSRSSEMNSSTNADVAGTSTRNDASENSTSTQ